MSEATADQSSASMAATSLWGAATSPAWAMFEEARTISQALSEQLKTPAAPTHSPGERGRESQESSDVYKALISSGIFKKTDLALVSTWSRQLKPVHFPAGHVVVEDGDFGGCFYVIVSGKVKVCHRRHGGCEVVLIILGPSDVFGALTLFSSGSRDVSVTSLTELWAVPIERNQFCAWMAEHPEISGQMLRLLARWTKTMTNFLFDSASADAQARIASRLLFLRKRFGWREGDAVRVDHDLTLEDFSLLVGVASETIGATLRDFEDRGWIRWEDRSVVIVDGEALGAVCHTADDHVQEAACD